jgi:hypothetical protein
LDEDGVPSKNRVWRDERCHLSQHGASQSLPEHREAPALCIGQVKSASNQLCLQCAVLFAKKRDHIALLALKPSEQRCEQHL